MPNWTYNNVQFIGKTEDNVKQLQTMLKSDDNEFDFNNVIPMPNELSDTVSGSENAKPEWQKEQSKKLKAKYGADNWYDWSINNWGTKWNACNTEVELNENVLNYTFETAWDAPREIVRALEHMKETILKDISIDWNCTHEDGNEEETLLEDKDE
tara:strand:- start:798 stop:1262 length:465 start_codon:yes stop_codon:yes gene_type:complete